MAESNKGVARGASVRRFVVRGAGRWKLVVNASLEQEMRHT